MFYLENPDTPTIQTSRFIQNQAAFVKCTGKLGKPQSTTDMYLERRLEDEQEFVSIVDGVVSNTEFSSSDCTSVKTMIYQFVMQSSLANAVFICRMSSEGGDIISDTVSVSVEPQGLFLKLSCQICILSHGLKTVIVNLSIML